MLLWLVIPGYLILNMYFYLRCMHWLTVAIPGYSHFGLVLLHGVIQIFLACTPLLAWLTKHKKRKWFFSHVTNIWLGVFIYSILFVGAVDAVSIFWTKTGLWQRLAPEYLLSNPDKVEAVAGWLLGTVIVGISVYGFYHSRRIHVNHYEVTCKYTGQKKDMKILLVADLHLGYNQGYPYLEKLVERMKKQQADMICFAGDMFDNDYDALLEDKKMIAKLRELKAPLGMYGCWGNHDVFEKLLGGFTVGRKKEALRDKRMEQFLEEAGIRMLNDECICIQGSCYLAGRKDSHKTGEQSKERLSVKELLAEKKENLPVIVMNHQPKELQESAEAGVNLLLAGHTHNGQFFPGNLLQKWICPNPWGIRYVDDMASVTTSGAGVWGPAIRVGTENEIAVIHVIFTPPFPSVHNE